MLKIVLIATLITFSSQNPTTNGCGPYCVMCNEDQICEACHMYKLVAGKCDQAKPAPENCELYGIKEDTKSPNCLRCKPGYSRNENVTPYQCVKGSIEGCFSQAQRKDFDTEGNDYCHNCIGSVPELFGRKCNSEYPLPENCLVASISNLGPKASCYICKSGYTSFQDKGCFISKIPGCINYLYEKDTICAMCDYTKGFYATIDNISCTKQ